ncbi:type II toxin-antitoxin system PemK/MazF family toxin [uncultured Streptococcus sp.]|uniref:type II toxin-antitoxin system PemK/MazF family toxin n=1 Tax=uncultured Streptococcus sp. TaxID=83427 RepID=UPI0027DDFE0A|nr:type II toxin-antitoxin system PemK/MazF family toxin [uncultured Streptococcus sp.]
MNTNYIPQKQDIVWIDFDPSSGKEIQKRRPAVVISNNNYNKQTGFIAVCPITHGQKRLQDQGLLVAVESEKVDGFVNPFQLHTFDYQTRKASKITELDDFAFAQVTQLIQYIF